jgi:hypothetical protein
MNIEKAIHIVKEKWDAQGECASCGWHAALEEYGDLSEAIYIDEANKRIELSCLGDDENSSSHKGVRIYFSEGKAG